MKLATVEYTGRVRHQRHRGPSGTQYRFGDGSEPVESRADLEHFEGLGNYEVEYTARGKLMNLVSDDLDDLSEAVEEMDYNVKRSLASSLNLEVDSREESVLEQAIEEQAQELKQQMEAQ